MKVTLGSYHWMIFEVLIKTSIDINASYRFLKLLVIKLHQKRLFTMGFAEFRRGCASVTDESREGRPNSVMFPKNIDAMHKMIKEDSYIS